MHRHLGRAESRWTSWVAQLDAGTFPLWLPLEKRRCSARNIAVLPSLKHQLTLEIEARPGDFEAGLVENRNRILQATRRSSFGTDASIFRLGLR